MTWTVGDIDMGNWGLCPICETPAPKMYIDNRVETIEYVAKANFAGSMMDIIPEVLSTVSHHLVRHDDILDCVCGQYSDDGTNTDGAAAARWRFHLSNAVIDAMRKVINDAG